MKKGPQVRFVLAFGCMLSTAAATEVNPFEMPIKQWWDPLNLDSGTSVDMDLGLAPADLRFSQLFPWLFYFGSVIQSSGRRTHGQKTA